MKEIQLTQGKVALVDDEDYKRLSQYKWQYHLGYAKRGVYNEIKKNNDSVKMHREIMNCPKGLVVHHKNHNRLDNRKENLLICSVRENHKSQKQKNKDKTTSKYQGVYVRNYSSGKIGWVARIKVDYKNIWLGTFEKEEQAAVAYNRGALKYHGKIAIINPVKDMKIPTLAERKSRSFRNLLSNKK